MQKWRSLSEFELQFLVFTLIKLDVFQFKRSRNRYCIVDEPYVMKESLWMECQALYWEGQVKHKLFLFREKKENMQNQEEKQFRQKSDYMLRFGI